MSDNRLVKILDVEFDFGEEGNKIIVTFQPEPGFFEPLEEVRVKEFSEKDAYFAFPDWLAPFKDMKVGESKANRLARLAKQTDPELEKEVKYERKFYVPGCWMEDKEKA